jgi:uncharacterized protein (UPF0262 family)
MSKNPLHRLTAIELDDSISHGLSAEADHERRVAIHDLLEENSFQLCNGLDGPYRLKLSTIDGKLVFDTMNQAEASINVVGLAMSPFRRMVKDYHLICESYYAAIKLSTPSQIETIDMARRGLHNEGSELLQQRLAGKIVLDFPTARRLFTLVSLLYWRGS